MPQVIELCDLTAPELSVFTRLTAAQLRTCREADNGLFIAESAKVILHALDAGITPVSLLCPRSLLSTQGADVLARCGEIPVYTADDALLEALTGYRLHRGVLCAMRRPAAQSAASVCADCRRIAVLEDIVDPTNVGAIFRAAAALGMDAVLLTPSCCDALHRRAVRVSMGTVFQVPWAVIGSAAQDWPEAGLQQLHALGFSTAALALDAAAVHIDDRALSMQEKLALILGTEGDGLSAATVAQCDRTVYIPMSHGVDSLNVASAAAVAFWQLGRHI